LRHRFEAQILMFNFYLTYKVSYPRSWLLLDVLLHTSFDNSKSHFEKKKIAQCAAQDVGKFFR